MLNLHFETSLKSKSKVASLFLILLCTTYSQAQKLEVNWGIESGLREEVAATAEQNKAQSPKAKKGEPTYRYFRVTPEYNDVSQMMMDRHWKIWPLYKQSLPKGQQPSRVGYRKFVEEKDPSFYGFVDQLAPRLFFNFLGESGKQYVLESIVEKTLRFDEYSGPGFTDNEEWYDIVLSHQPGLRTSPVASMLRFTASGRANLRLWSDNFNENSGLTPMGCYLIEITFNFRVDGKTVSVKTEAFKIDI